MAQYGPLSHFVGLTKYKRKRRCPPMSSTSGNNHGKAPKIVTYCPFCPQANMAHPENHPHATVTASATKGSCSKGHTWKVSTRAYSDERYKELSEA